ncbi:hypothetical protein IW492_01905 [Enterococcus sp. BWB1-3]|uniref:hypothetical protein n=1 Tax=Enterococcus sp. BWB1-3 TaxID=2787713 RepID=UPI00192466B3|nr:hypothetical protein [Enterococcus sp. BWB1-3]MBL1227983.1 hypothetical protein [Enterococcus sp. BWB1-3]
MKKIGLFLLAMVTVLGFTGCGSSEDKDGSAVSTKQSTEDKTANETKKMEAMQKDLEDMGVEIRRNTANQDIEFTREKGIDYDYFWLVFNFRDVSEIREIRLQLKGSIDGEKKDTLYYEVKQGRMVESTVYNTDIDLLAETLESINYSDTDMIKFALWYNKSN